MFKKISLCCLIILALVSCSQNKTTVQPKAELQSIKLGVGYVPNIQFAPYYVAQAKGFFAENGLEVSLEHGYENDFVVLTATGERLFAVASGDQVILARSQGLPIVYVMKWYQRFPVAVMTLKSSGITTPQQLMGHSVGTPVLSGASYVGWKALAFANKLDETAIKLDVIGYAQAEAVTTKKVDASVVYIANEPVQLTKQGIEVNLFQVSDYIDLVSNGLVTNEKIIKEQPDLVRRMVKGSLQGLQYTIDHPDEAFQISRKYIPDMTDANAPTQRAVLEASITMWRSDKLGLSNQQAWADSVKFMQATNLIKSDIEVNKLYTNEFVENK